MIIRLTQTKRDQGFVIVLVLISMLIMSFFLITGTATTTTAIKVSGNYNKSVDAFNIAEAGLNRARPLVEAATSFSTFLGSYSQGYLVAPTAFNNGSYQVTVTNDEKEGANTTTDANNIIKVISRGTSQSGSSSVITTYMQKVGGSNPATLPAAPGGGESAAVVCGSSVGVTIKDEANMNGNDDRQPPCGMGVTPCGGTEATGVNTNDLISAAALGSCSGCGSIQKAVDASTNCNQWRTLNNQLAALNSSNPNVVVLSGENVSGTVSTCDNPKVIIISTTNSSFEIKSGVKMCGTIVVASDTNILPQDGANIVGLWLFMGGNSGTKRIKLTSQGNSNFYGKMVFGSSEEANTKTLQLEGQADFFYSSDALTYATQAINNASGGGGGSGTAQLMTIGWEESY